jgi:hypothetical protein
MNAEGRMKNAESPARPGQDRRGGVVVDIDHGLIRLWETLAGFALPGHVLTDNVRVWPLWTKSR